MPIALRSASESSFQKAEHALRAATGCSSAPCGAFGVSLSRWLPALADEVAANKNRKRSCILLWMTGGPSQIDTFDPKPGHANGGPFKPIETSRAGHPDRRAPAEAGAADASTSCRHPLDDHQGRGPRAGHVSRCAPATCRRGRCTTRRSARCLEQGARPPDAELPGFVSIAPYRFLNPAAYRPGFPRAAVRAAGRRRRGTPAVPQNYDDAAACACENLDLPAASTSPQADARLESARRPGGRLSRSRPGRSPRKPSARRTSRPCG